MPQLLHSHWITNGHIHQKPLPTSTKPESADDHLQRDDHFRFPFKISARQLFSPTWSVMAIIYRFILAYYVFENLIQWTTFCLLPLFPPRVWSVLCIFTTISLRVKTWGHSYKKHFRILLASAYITLISTESATNSFRKMLYAIQPNTGQ